MEIKFEVTRDLDEQFIEDLLVTAFDAAYGGCLYWIESYDVTGRKTFNDKPVWTDVSIAYEDPDDEGVMVGAVVNSETIVKGLKLSIKKGGHFGDKMAQALVEMDGGMIDAGDVDNLVQRGLFGEVLFG